jgi:predicted adenylyl cyclase CyaB
MIEIEIKVMVDDFNVLSHALKAKRSPLLNQTDDIYLPHGINFQTINKGTPVLRIRRLKQQGSNTAQVTYKKSLANELICHEIEFGIDMADILSVQNFIAELGYSHVVQVVKKRRVYKFGRYQVCLDNVNNLGRFIEIEYMAPNDTSLKEQQEIQLKMYSFLEKKLGATQYVKITQQYDRLLTDKTEK